MNNIFDILISQRDWTRNNLKDQVYELFRSKNVMVRLVSSIQFMLVYHVDFRKQLQKVKEGLIFVVGHLPKDDGAAQYDYLNTIQTLIIQESLVMSSHLMFFANTPESIQKKFQMSLNNFVFKDINMLKDIIQSGANDKLINLFSEYIPSNVLSPFKYLGPCSPQMFVGRESLISEIIEGNHSGHAITGGRRIGKTSLLLKIQDEIAKGRKSKGRIYNKETGKFDEFQAYECCYIDCINIYLFQTVYNEIFRKLNPRVIFKEHYDNPIRYIVSRSCALAKKKLLLLLDEMDDLMAMASANDKDAIAFSNNLQAAANEGMIKFVISGFRNISELIVDAKHPFYNLCKGRYMSVLNKNNVQELIVKSSFNNSFEIKDENIESVVQEIYTASGGYPSVVQFVADQILKEKSNNSITSENVKKVMDSKETKDFVLETIMMNTNPFERFICILASKMDLITSDNVIDCIENDHDIIINDIDKKVFSALKNLCYNCILDDSGSQYTFLYPLLPIIINKYLMNSIPRLKRAILSEQSA
jgi:hypothetical protein